MYAMLVRGYTDLQVETKTGLGGTQICFDALANNQIDMLSGEHRVQPCWRFLHASGRSRRARRLAGDRDSVYASLSVNSLPTNMSFLEWLQPIGFNNAYALMMRREGAGATIAYTVLYLIS